MTLDRDVNWVLIKCQPKCQWKVIQGYQSRVPMDSWLQMSVVYMMLHENYTYRVNPWLKSEICFGPSHPHHQSLSGLLCQIILVTNTLNSVTPFWLAKSVQWIFEISTCDVITADYTIIMSRTLKVMGNHVKVTCFVLLPFSEEEKHDLHFFSLNVRIINQLLELVFVISKIIKVLVRVIRVSLRLRLLTLTPV